MSHIMRGKSYTISSSHRYGKGVRKLVAGNYDIIYRHTGGRVIMLAAIPARLIR